MKKFIIATVVTMSTIGLSGCGKVQQLSAHWTGDATETCHDGVVYLQFTSGASVKYDRTSHVVTCN